MGFEGFKAGSPYEEFEKSLTGLSSGTGEIYRSYLKEFLDFNESTPLKFYEWIRELEVSPDMRNRKQLTIAFNVFAAKKIEAGVSPNTVANYRKAIHKFLDANELTIRIKSNGRKPRYAGQDTVTRDQVKRLIELAATNLRLRALLYTLKDSGLGVSEAALLTVEDFLSTVEIKDSEGRRFKKWSNPIVRAKTGELCEVCLGPESIAAIEDYLGNRRSGALFLTSKGQPHKDEDGNITAEAGFTEKGSPMTASAITSSIRNHCRVLKNKGYKVSAHSFRKLFETSFSVEGVLDLAKKIMGKAIAPSDKPYLIYADKLLTKYAEVYVKHLLLSDEARELSELKEKQAQQNGTVEAMREELEALQETVNGLSAISTDTAQSAEYWRQLALSKMTESERKAQLDGEAHQQIADMRTQLETESDPTQRRILSNLIEALESGWREPFLTKPHKIGKVS